MYWKNKRVIVTGGCGMVGYQLVPMLVEGGAEVMIVTHMPPHESLRRQDVTYYIADAGSTEDMYSLFYRYNPHVVLNLAASVSGLFWNLANQATQFWLNARLQFAPLLAATQVNVPVFVQVSTVCVYDPIHNTRALEKNGHKGKPVTGYAWAKRMGERGVGWICDSSHEGVMVIVRPANMYGENDQFGSKIHVIPAFIKHLVDKDEPLKIFGDGLQTREFLHAEDCAGGIMAATEYGRHGDVYNLGTDGETQISMLDLACMIKEFTGSQCEIVTNPDEQVYDRDRFIVSQKAASELGWRYRIGLEDGLKRTIHWYKHSKHRRGIEINE